MQQWGKKLGKSGGRGDIDRGLGEAQTLLGKWKLGIFVLYSGGPNNTAEGTAGKGGN